jgi:hypothetical protein
VFDPTPSADSKKKSLGEFFGKVVRKATPPADSEIWTVRASEQAYQDGFKAGQEYQRRLVSTIEEDSDTSDSDGVIDASSFCQIPAYWVD